jgi:hypothetical protein
MHSILPGYPGWVSWHIWLAVLALMVGCAFMMSVYVHYVRWLCLNAGLECWLVGYIRYAGWLIMRDMVASLIC